MAEPALRPRRVKPFLDDRWSEGCTNAWKLWEEIVPLGYKGSYQRVRAYLHVKRTSPRPVTARPPSPRTVAGWVLRHPDALTETEQLQLKAVRAHCPELDALTRHVRSFATTLTERKGERLPDWLDAVRQDDLPSLHTLAAGIDRGCVGFKRLWSTSCGRVRRVTVDLRVMPVEFARKSPGWMMVWSTVLRRERSAAAVERAAAFLGRGCVGGIGRGVRHGRPDRGPYDHRAGGLSGVRVLVGANTRLLPAISS
ncbi:hypothetical protein ACH5A3_41530 [Streptomyces echinatus]|uniref:hypothetical protein n=1 Tax=Streptomyces echinatus TaxID=67293 RepID=UPI0037BB8A42